MKLGTAAQYVIGTKQFDQTKEFVDKIPLDLVEEGTSPQGTKFALYTDGRANILVDETNYPENYSGIIYFNDQLEDLIPELKELGLNVEEIHDGENLFSGMFLTPDNVAINVVNVKHPGSPNPMGDSSVSIGKFGEYAIKVEDLDNSISFWEKLGFEVLLKEAQYNYAILSDALLVIGLHSHEMDARPALTYFNPNMNDPVNSMKDRGISMRSEDERDDKGEMVIDATAESPDGQVWYFFSGVI